MVQVARLRRVPGLVAADRGQGEVLDAVPLAVVDHAVNVSREDSGHVSCLHQPLVHPLPVVPVLAPIPAGVVKEDEDVAQVPGLLQRALEEGELGLAHALAGGLVEVLLPGDRVALVRVEGDEHRALVAEGVPEGTEVLLVVGVVLALGPAVAAPVDVVVAGDREPGAGQPVHDPGELVRLLLPLLRAVVALDHVAHRHHEVGVDDVHVLHRLGQDLHPAVGAAGAVAEDREDEGAVLIGQLEALGVRAVGQEALVRRFREAGHPGAPEGGEEQEVAELHGGVVRSLRTGSGWSPAARPRGRGAGA